MKINLQALTDALRQHVGSGFASAFQCAVLTAIPGAEVIQDDATGVFLLRALLRWTPPELPLLAVSVPTGSGFTPYEQDDSTVPRTLAEALAASLMAGARSHFMDPTWSTGILSITESEGPLCGTAQLYSVSSGLTVVGQYGAPSLKLPMVTYRMIYGEALFAAGRQAWETSRPPLISLLREVQISAPAASGAIH